MQRVCPLAGHGANGLVHIVLARPLIRTVCFPRLMHDFVAFCEKLFFYKADLEKQIDDTRYELRLPICMGCGHLF